MTEKRSDSNSEPATESESRGAVAPTNGGTVANALRGAILDIKV